MAVVFPSHVLDTTRSNAERRLFDLLETQLSSDFVVFHSVAWLSRDVQGMAQDGEADFVIAHPAHGVLVLEVKGGRILYDGVMGQWASVDRHGVIHDIKDPLLQAKNASYNLYRKVKDAPLTQEFRYTVRHAVCFPDVIVDQDLRLDLPAELVIDKTDLHDLRGRIEQIFAYWRSNQPAGQPGLAGIDALIRLLAPQIKLRSFLGGEFESEAEQIKHLTEQQFDTLGLLTRERRAIIFGCAGSGKTMLALEKARRLANEGFAVLFICFNARLADWLRATTEFPQGVDVTHFHQLCYDFARQASVNIPPLESDAVQGDEEYFFDLILPQALLDAAELLGPRYDALVVDEGQDFNDSWWVALESILANPAQDIFYIFCDDNQNIYAGAEQRYPFHSPSMTLSKNCRNTKQIHEIVTRYYRGVFPLKSQGPDGRPPEFHPATSPSEIPALLRRCLHELVGKERVPPQEIIVLTPRSRKKSVLHDGMKLGNLTLSWQPPLEPGQIECSTIHSFKGLERPVVILTELDQLTHGDREMLLYVAVSRARHHLIVIGEL